MRGNETTSFFTSSESERLDEYNRGPSRSRYLASIHLGTLEVFISHGNPVIQSRPIVSNSLDFLLNVTTRYVLECTVYCVPRVCF